MLGHKLQPLDVNLPAIPSDQAGQELALVTLWQAQYAWTEKVGLVPKTPGDDQNPGE
jgi:hypothetical protein